MKILYVLPLLFPLALNAQSVPTDDGPWITVTQGMVWSAAGYTMDDIVAMANLDGDPLVVTADEQAMIDLLAQVLGASPISGQSGS